MGQQQLLLIVLGTIIVGVAVVVGINMFTSVTVVTGFGADPSNANGSFVMSTINAGDFILTATGATEGVVIVTTITQGGVSGTPTITLP